MKNFTNSDYALNKYSEGIVYRFADEIVVVTLADFLASNPGNTETDFLRLKKESDKMFLKEDRAYNAQTKRNVRLDTVSDSLKCSEPSVEEQIFNELEEAERENFRKSRASQALDKLTEVQRRRYILHYVRGLTTRQIAEKEGVTHQSVVENLMGAEKKIKKILENG